MLTAEIWRVTAAEREAALNSPEHVHRQRWLALREVERVERQLVRARSRWNAVVQATSAR